MNDRYRIAVFVAAGALLLAVWSASSGSAVAQSDAEPERLPPVAPATPQDDPGLERSLDTLPRAPGPDASDAARAAHLDQLFGRLAMEDNPDCERVQGQIWAAWNRSGSASMDFLAARADQAMAKRDYDAAKSYLNDLVRLAPDFAEGWNKRATMYFVTDEYGRSLDDIGRVLKLEPRHFGALSGLGIILDRLGDEAGALEAYRRAARIHPNLPGAQEGIKKLSKEVEGHRL